MTKTVIQLPEIDVRQNGESFDLVLRESGFVLAKFFGRAGMAEENAECCKNALVLKAVAMATRIPH